MNEIFFSMLSGIIFFLLVKPEKAKTGFFFLIKKKQRKKKEQMNSVFCLHITSKTHTFSNTTTLFIR